MQLWAGAWSRQPGVTLLPLPGDIAANISHLPATKHEESRYEGFPLVLSLPVVMGNILILPAIRESFYYGGISKKIAEYRARFHVYGDFKQIKYIDVLNH